MLNLLEEFLLLDHQARTLNIQKSNNKDYPNNTNQPTCNDLLT